MQSIFTKNRAECIKKVLLKKRPYVRIYNGKSHVLIQLKKKMIGHKLGEFSLTKKLGKKIHDSERSKKRKNKKKHK
jgi:ribosomal protein S19